MELTELIAELSDGGVVARRRLLAHGADPREISRLRHAGRIEVVRPGWYATQSAEADVVSAVQAGAVLTCASALRFAPGVWVPPGIARSHRRWPARQCKQRTHAGCRAHRTLAAPRRAVDPLPIALQCAANCLEEYYVVAVLDSTLRMPSPYSLEDVYALFEGAPLRTRRLLALLDPRAESGTESVARVRLHDAHIPVRSQVVIPGVGRVDLLVGESLILECDSRNFHNDDQRKRDIRRDRRSTVAGYSVLRVDYDDVMFGWDAVLEDVRDMVRTGRHRGRVRSALTNVD